MYFIVVNRIFTSSTNIKKITVMQNKIKQLLKERHLKAVGLAEYLGVRPAHLTQWTKGVCNPNLVNAMKIALFFQLSVEDIFILDLQELTEDA